MKPQINVSRDSNGDITGWVIHKVIHNGYKFSLWYNSHSQLVDLEKYKCEHSFVAVRIGEADRNYFRVFNRIKTGVDLNQILPFHLAK